MHEIKHSKPNAFYDTFERKGPGQEISHYCPGCGHGVVHNMIAEAIDDFNIQDKVIFCSPVGCSVFAYYYFDVGNVQCAHGRAPAVATAAVRSNRDSIVISYQGDGDLAGIGLGNIMHAANRGENMAVFFINNAIYGMTGGQMAPTTLLDQVTQTTPRGRDAENDGYPIKMAEIMETLKAPVFIERVSLADGPRVMKARRAVRKALQNQVKKKGFSFVEILSPCPINWKMSPMEARTWMMEKLEVEFPVKSFRDLREDELPPPTRNRKAVEEEEVLEILGVNKQLKSVSREKPVENQKVKIAGFGGQGVISAGILLSNCAVAEGLNTTWLPSYGPEMRGGTANASVNISEDVIGSPIVTYPNVLIALNAPSLDAFEDKVRPGGTIFVNSSLIKRKVQRDDVKAVYIPASDIANEIGVRAALNVVILTVYACMSGIFSADTIRDMLPASLKKKTLLDANMKAVDAGVIFYEDSVK